MNDDLTPEQIAQLRERVRTQPILQGFFNAIGAVDPLQAAQMREVQEEGEPDAGLGKFLDALDGELEKLLAPERAKLDQAREEFLSLLADATTYRWELDGDETGDCSTVELLVGWRPFTDLAEALGIKPPTTWRQTWEERLAEEIAKPACKPTPENA